MSTEQMATAEAFASRLESGNGREECAHVTFPEVGESWVAGLIGQAILSLADMIQTDGMTLAALESAAEHAFVMVAAAGMAHGRADASAALVSLEDIAWDTLPDVFGEEQGGE